MNITVRNIVSERAWRGSHELARESTVHSAQPILRVFGRTIPLGKPVVVVENIHKVRDWQEYSIDAA